MIKSFEDISETKKRLAIEIPAEDTRREYDEYLREVGNQAKVPGFRKGKVPLNILKKRFGPSVEGEVMERLLAKAYSDALKEKGISPIIQPSLEEGPKFSLDNPITLTLSVEVRPNIENLKYDAIEINAIPSDVTAEDIDGTLERIREDRATFEPSESGIEDGDIVTFGLKQGETDHGSQFLRVGSGFFPEALSKEVSGKKKGDSFESELEFGESFHIKDLAGKKAKVSVSISDIKKPKLPEIGEGLAKDLGFDDLSKLREHIESELKKSKEAAARRIQKAETLKKIIESVEFELPETLLASEIRALTASAKGGSPEEAFDEAKTKELKDAAKRNVKASVILDIIAEKESIKVSEEDVKASVIETAMRMRTSPENVIKYYVARDGSIDGLKRSVMEEKVLNLLLQKAIIK